LRLHPQDQAVAEGWLEHLLDADYQHAHHHKAGHEPDYEADHELAARVSEAQNAHEKVQTQVMRFFLSARRSDFAAMQTYRRVWRYKDDISADMLADLAGILLEKRILSDWALRVYLKAQAAGAKNCLPALQAAVRRIVPNAQNRNDLAAARQIVSGNMPDKADIPGRTDLTDQGDQPIPPSQPSQPNLQNPRDQRIGRFAATAKQAGALQERAPAADAGRPLKAAARSLWGTGAQLAEMLRQRTAQAIDRWHGRFIDFMEHLRRRPGILRRALAFTVIGLSAGTLMVVGWLAMNRPVAKQPEEPPAQTLQKPIVSDPFTIQVAAYVQPKDADRLVVQLKQQGLDAFWTRAASANRTWYQVKVSHFATKIQAQQFGEQLKAEGLIDDFFVANYTPPEGL
jgi:hypothetical protein